MGKHRKIKLKHKKIKTQVKHMIFIPKKKARKIKKRLLEESQIRLKKQMDESIKEWKKSKTSTITDEYIIY